MTLLEHIEELRVRLVRIILTIVVITVFSFTFGFKEFLFRNTTLYLPFPDIYNNIASQLIIRIQSDLLPSYVKIIITSPSEAFLAQIYTAVFLGVFVGMPIIIREIAAFVNPALYSHERKMILNLLLPATTLFVIGAIFSYMFVTPFAFDFLYRYGLVFGAATYITLDGLMSFVLLFTLALGLSFQLPILMWVITVVGLVQPKFWRDNLSYAIVAMVIFGAIVTPDGSGVTMWFIALPMITLYGLAYLLLKRRMKNINKKT